MSEMVRVVADVVVDPLSTTSAQYRTHSFCRLTVKHENLAIPALPFEIEYLPALSRGNLPAGSLPFLISCAMRVNLFRATQQFPAGGFPTPEICHFLFPCAENVLQEIFRISVDYAYS